MATIKKDIKKIIVELDKYNDGGSIDYNEWAKIIEEVKRDAIEKWRESGKIICILKTIKNDEKDGFPKLWVRTYKTQLAYEKAIPNPRKHFAWYVWRVYYGEKLIDWRY